MTSGLGWLSPGHPGSTASATGRRNVAVSSNATTPSVIRIVAAIMVFSIVTAAAARLGRSSGFGRPWRSVALLECQERTLHEVVRRRGQGDRRPDARRELPCDGKEIQVAAHPEPQLVIEVEGIRDRPEVPHGRAFEPGPERMA